MATSEHKLVSAAEFMNMPEPLDGSVQELVRGTIVTMPPPRFRHGKRQFRIARLIDLYVAPLGLGQVITETGVVTQLRPDSVRGPDVAYWSAKRLLLDSEPEGYPVAAPDLCVEISSPGETSDSILEKVAEYFSCGVRLVWYADPEARTVTVFRPRQKEQLLRDDDLVSGEDVIPGFSCRLAGLFA